MNGEKRDKLQRRGEEAPYEGRYVYCVAESSKLANFGKIGIENNEVYTIPHGRICAVVHNCLLKPYKSKDEEEVKNWVKTHQNVIKKTYELGTVIPLSFDIIIKGSNRGVSDWLKREHKSLMQKINRVKGKQEFGIQIFWDKDIISKKISKNNKEIERLRKMMEGESKGRAYFLKHKLGAAIKGEIEKTGNECFRELYRRIRKHADDIRVGRVEKDKRMLMNLSCLVHKNKVKELGAVLGGINNLEGFSVRFTGPWPPYSFV